MIEQVINFLLRFKWIILFYLAIIILLVIKRKRIQVQAKFIFLYRMKWGLKWMDKYANKFREWVILIGYVGVGAGFVGMLVISILLVKNIIDYFAADGLATGASIVYPGMNVPGLGILPFWDWILAIFIIAVVHEFSHGILARAHNIEVKNTGIVLFGPILGAFVEPDEKKMRKESDIKQYSVLAAGSFSNVLLAVLALLLLSFVFVPIQGSMTNPAGFTFNSYAGENMAFETAQISPGTIITEIDGISTLTFQAFSDEFQVKKPGDIVNVGTNSGDVKVTLASNPDNEKKPFLGIREIRNEVSVKSEYSSGFSKAIYLIISWATGFMRWLFLLSFGIGLFNLLPLPIVDGGRMAQVFLHKWKGIEIGERRYRKISLFFLVLLLVNLFLPLFGKLF
jgi:membrane-associated protease RseP (regulator of RpoE activity)